MGIKSRIFKKQFEKKNKKMFFNDPFYTTNFSPRYNTISQYANRTCNCPECRPSARRVHAQQTRREMPRRRQVPNRQINVPNPEEWFHQQNQTAKEPRKKPRKPQKTVLKPFQNQSRSQISTTNLKKMPPKPVEIPVEIVNAPKVQQKKAEKIGDRKILIDMENLILEELSTPIEIKEDPFHADEEIIIP